jgi:hypothetical protein
MRQLRHKLTTLSAALVIVGCSDNQQPTSPVSSRSASRDAALSQGTQTTSKPQPGPVAFTKIAMYYGLTETIAAGSAGGASVQCPAGSVPTGGGYEVYTNGGTVPFLHISEPASAFGNPTGWRAAADNTQSGSAPINLQAWVLCAS